MQVELILGLGLWALQLLFVDLRLAAGAGIKRTACCSA
jgi:hypothetical protein